MKQMIIPVFSLLTIVGACISASAEQITRHVDEFGSEDWYWTTKVTVNRGEAHTFWIKDLTEDTEICSLEISCEYSYFEEGETCEESIFTSESCEVENAFGGWDKYQLFASNEWEYVHASVTSLTFAVRVDGFEPDTAADARFSFGHSSGDDKYPERDTDTDEEFPDGGSYSEEIGGTMESSGIWWTFMVTNHESSVISCDAAAYPYSRDIFDTMGRGLEIPDTLGGHPVTAIDDCAFYNNYYMLACTIPLSVRRIGDSAFSLCCGLEEMTIPSSVEQIDAYAFAGCDGLTSLTIKSGVKSIGDYAFSGCTGLTSVTIPSSVTSIGKNAFFGCSGLTTVTIPASVSIVGEDVFGGCCNITSVKVPGEFALAYMFPDAYEKIKSVQVVKGSRTIREHAYDGCSSLMSVTVQTDVMRVGDAAFQDCHKLSKVTFQGNAPDLGAGVFSGTPQSLTITVPDDSTGWSKPGSAELPECWGGRAIATASGATSPEAGSASGGTSFNGTIIVTNVVVHYIVNSIQPNLAIPLTTDTKFVNVVTEVKGGNVAIPDTWAVNYPTFASKYGSDFATALTKTTGKVDATGNPMFVWQDYVAGTDPTKEDDVFTASIALVDGVPFVSYTPELTEEQKALRTYKTYGKKQLHDTDWTDITNLDGEARKPYNFFKVTVEMK